MKRFKGPELKLSQLKVPPVARDLYLDLKDRRLLPLVGLVLVAIVATPFLLGGGGGVPVEPAPVPSAGGSAREATLAVLPSEPGLREPSKRLAGRASKNPFRPHYTAPVLNQGAAPTVETETSTGGGSTTSLTETAPETSSGGGGSSSPPPAPEPQPTVTPSPDGSSGQSGNHGVPEGGTLYTLEVTLQVTRIESKTDGTVDKKGPTVYKDIQAPAPVPGEKTPVITYLGMGSKGKVPMFLVSNEVTAIFGEAKCISGAKTCQLLVLEEGFPVTFVYGDNAVRYKINLIKAVPIVTGHS